MPPKPPSPPARTFVPRKLLVAALGVATINYVGVAACGNTSDDDMKRLAPTSGNLPSQPPPDDQYVPPPTSGNLPAPPPMDAAADADAGSDDASDAGDGGD